MKTNFLTFLGMGAFALVVGMNIKYAADNYGILDNNLAVQVLAQDNSSDGGGSSNNGGGGSDSGNGGNSGNNGGDSNGGDSGDGGGTENKPKKCEDSPNNANGGNPALYCDLKGRPEECTIKRWIEVSGQVVISETKPEVKGSWRCETVKGVKDLCPLPGNGCTVYSCKEM